MFSGNLQLLSSFCFLNARVCACMLGRRISFRVAPAIIIGLGFVSSLIGYFKVIIYLLNRVQDNYFPVC